MLLMLIELVLSSILEEKDSSDQCIIMDVLQKIWLLLHAVWKSVLSSAYIILVFPCHVDVLQTKTSILFMLLDSCHLVASQCYKN